MRRSFLLALAAVLVGPVLAAPIVSDSSEGNVNRWDFNVYLDDKLVGNHSFQVIDNGDHEQVISVADFKVRFLFIPAYSFSHSNSERWTEGCLIEFEAKTLQNGRRIEVSGEQTGTGLRIDNGESQFEIADCVMSFAYWNPEFLEQARLLNPQSGEYLDVKVEQLPPDVVEVRGEEIPASRYKVTALKLELTLWYSSDDEWLALESIAKGGRVIRYELS